MVRARLGPQTIRDYAKFPEHVRVELIAGRIVDSLKRTLRHQDVLGNLLMILHGQTHYLGVGQVLPSPLDCEFGPKDVIQPDIVYVSNERKRILRRCVKGAPDIAIEILGDTAAERGRDRLKMDRYRVFDVPQCWLVDPKNEVIKAYVNRRRRWKWIGTWRPGDMFVPPNMRGVLVTVSGIFEK